MKNLTIYDNGGETYDRITVIFNDTKKPCLFGGVEYEAIAASETGRGFYQHTIAQRGKHLGKKINFNNLSLPLQNKILIEINNK